MTKPQFMNSKMLAFESDDWPMKRMNFPSDWIAYWASRAEIIENPLAKADISKFLAFLF